MNALFKGIPQSGTTLGAPAPVTMTEFIDPQCPYCREFETTVLPGLVTEYVRTGKLRIQMEPWAFIGPDSVRGQAPSSPPPAEPGVQLRRALYFNQGVENTGWLTDSVIAQRPRASPASRFTPSSDGAPPGWNAAKAVVDMARPTR